ncbi:protein FRIGIDA [Dendrobium catenatum]|uniref:protein FRIGIDA n=1 Tax=Dendrobium catenatum TaxID=906689 RepID=UPI0009F229EB|nr:protein FRIGIDA [Dendrobium catenatum]
MACEVNEEEYEDYEEVELVEDVEGEDYEEAFEEEEAEVEQNEEEKEIEQNEEEEIEQNKEEEEEIEPSEEEEEIEPSEEEEEEEIEPIEEEEEAEIEQNKEEEEEIEPSEEEEEEEIEQNKEEEEEIEPSEEEEEEEEIEQNEDEEEEEEIEQKDEEEEIKQNNKEVEIERNEEEEEDEKKAVKVLKVKEEEQSIEDPVRKEKKSANPENMSESEGKALPRRTAFPPFLQSVSDLEKLHCALSKFLYQWNCLNQSLDSIGAAIDAHAPPQHDVRSPEQEKDELIEQKKEKDDRSEQDKEKDERSEQEKEKDKRSCEILCEQMQGKALRKYIESNFYAVDRLRQEVPEALRRFRDPEQLVFKAIGEFWKEGSRPSKINPPLLLPRRGSILLLEFFVLSGRPTVADSSVKQKAKLGALSWLKRLVKENIESATAVDSLGLILYLACFGIPKEFGSKDLCVLLLKSNLKINIDVFLKSSILVERIPGVIKDLIRGEMYLEAAELSCYFGLTDTFPPLPLLSSGVAKVLQTGTQERQKYRDLPKSKNEAYIRELKSLRSVVQCLKDHNFVERKFDSISLTERISKLERIVEKAEKPVENKIRKRKAKHLKAGKKSKSQSKESVPSTSEAAQLAPSRMIQDKPEPGFPSQPLFPESKVENYVLSAEVSNTRDYPYLWERKYFDSSTGYRSLAMEYSSAQHFSQPQPSLYGNSGGITGRNLYQFADTAIQEEAQLAKSSRCSNTSPSGSKFGRY